MRLGDCIAIKAAYTQKQGLPFDTHGNTASVMKIKVTGVVVENPGDGRQIHVHWQRLSAPREWLFHTNRRTIWRVVPGHWQDDALIAFTFQNQPQDLDRFRHSPFWRDRFGDSTTSPHRFRWASFYQALADALRAHRRDRQPLVQFLKDSHARFDGVDDVMSLVHRIAQRIGGTTTWRDVSNGLSRTQREKVDAPTAGRAVEALVVMGLENESGTNRRG